MPGALSGMSIQKEGASMTIGQKIRMFRKERHLTLRELGELAGFPNRGDVRIAQYENGSRIPKNEILNRIASALGVTVEEIAGVECRGCPYRKRKQPQDAIIHLENDPGYETDVKEYGEPDEEGLLYDNLD